MSIASLRSHAPWPGSLSSRAAVRFEPGQQREVTLVPYGGERRVFGFQQKIMGDL